MIRFGCLGSGSSGNGLVVESSEGGSTTRVLLDCGFGLRDTVARLARLALAPGDIDAILVTHEHSDHAAGVFRIAARHGVPVHLTHGTYAASVAAGYCDRAANINIIDSHQALSIGGLRIEPFPVPHDAREPVQYVFSDGARRLGVLTDAGHVTPHMLRTLDALDALVLECNHDLGMLRTGAYPPSLKRRIASAYGHLDNAAAGKLLSGIERSRLQHLVAAHLSRENNSPALARQALATAAGCDESWIGVADQECGFDWRSIA